MPQFPGVEPGVLPFLHTVSHTLDKEKAPPPATPSKLTHSPGRDSVTDQEDWTPRSPAESGSHAMRIRRMTDAAFYLRRSKPRCQMVPLSN